MTPTLALKWHDRELFIKRDELLDTYFSGNKYRKLYYYLKKKPFAHTKIISYGGIQSNAMLSMAALASSKKIPFVYYTRYLPKQLSLSDESNYSKALCLGMEVVVTEQNNDEEIRSLLMESEHGTSLFIPQGGASTEAKFGVDLLAQEIVDWKKETGIEDLVVVTPSGTGTTALWLHQYLSPKDIEVMTTAVVGDRDYLEEQMLRLSPGATLPTIISTKKKYTFAKPELDLYKQYRYFLDLGLEFDLIYASVMWQALEENKELLIDKRVLYVHSGGLIGNKSQLKRYAKIIESLQ